MWGEAQDGERLGEATGGLGEKGGNLGGWRRPPPKGKPHRAYGGKKTPSWEEKPPTEENLLDRVLCEAVGCGARRRMGRCLERGGRLVGHQGGAIS